MIIISKKLCAGFTLLELAASLGVAGSIAIVSNQESKFEAAQAEARALGNEVFVYNSGVSRYLAANAGDSTIAGTYIGSDWLKNSADCSGGLAGDSFLSCEVLLGGETLTHRLAPTTVISYSASGDLSARTVWDTLIGEGGDADSMSMGMAALVASGNYISQHDDAASGYQSPTVFCPDISSHSATIASICSGDKNVIVSTAGLTSAVEPWLRTDHGNTMRHIVEFDTSGARSTDADLQALENRSNDSWLRQVAGVARIYNESGGGGQSLTIGGRSGSGIYSYVYLVSNSLLSGSVIIDSNAAVMNDIYGKSDAFIRGSIRSENGDIVAESGDVISENGQVRGDSVRSLGNVIADNSVYSQRYYDSNDASYYLDPDSLSNISDLSVDQDVRARRLIDQDNSSYISDPSGLSELNVVDIKSRLTVRDHLHLTKAVIKGNTCTPNGLLAVDVSGKTLSCQSGEWRPTSSGTPPGMYGYFNRSTCPSGWVKANGGNGTRDVRGRFLRAWDNGKGIDSGRSLGSYQGDTIRNIYGNISHGLAWSSTTNGVFRRTGTRYSAPHGARWGNGGRTIFDASRVVPTSHENRPKNVALLVCMKE